MSSITLESPLSAQHRAAGASLSTYFGVELPAEFAGFAAEYHMARKAAALVDTNFRAVFHLTGPDRVRYLNAILTSNIRDLAPGGGALGLLLNSQGHILAELETLAQSDRLIVFGHQLVHHRTAETLEKFIIMDDATFADETLQAGTLAVEGPAAAAIVQELTGLDLNALGEHGHMNTAVCVADGPIPCTVIHHSQFGQPGAEFLVRRDSLPALWKALAAGTVAHGGGPVGYLALNALRLEAGVPWFGEDFDDRNIPHEADLQESHISYIKGCYTGQEIVERVRTRGHVNRRRTALQFKSADVPDAGAQLLSEGTEVGRVTSAAFSPRLGCAIAMGYLRREHSQPGSVLECGALRAEVITLPVGSAGSVKC